MANLNFRLSDDVQDLNLELKYILKIFSKSIDRDFSFNGPIENAIKVGIGGENYFQINKNAFKCGEIKFNRSGFIETSSGEIDYFGTAFYLINSVQEYDKSNLDKLNRFRFANSYQDIFKNQRENIVQNCFDEIASKIGIAGYDKPSSFFLSHDIDLVNSAILEDGYFVLKKGRIDLFFIFLLNIFLKKPDWLNMDKIMKIESEYDCKSTFFWLVNKGQISKHLKNADYNFKSKPIKSAFHQVQEKDFVNGLHKSLSNDNFNDEIKKFGSHPIANRYHYLKFTLPEAYYEIEDSGIKMDASLGYAEEIGFRNSYGNPFQPFNFRDRRPFNFIEMPLHIMDRTLFQYKNYSLKESEEIILNFFEKNIKNCVLTVLWHNNFFSEFKYKGYTELFKKILSFIHDNKFHTLSPEEIIHRYSIK